MYTENVLKLVGKTLGNNRNNIIEINGKRYDAISGAFLGDSSKQPVQNATPARRAPATFVDGYKSTAGVAATAAKRAAHSSPVHLPAHRPQPAKTLMRTAVKKPDIKSPAHLKAQTRTDILARSPAQAVTPKPSYSSIDPRRAKKATQMAKSPAVSRYGTMTQVASLTNSAFAFRSAAPVSEFRSSSARSHAASPVPAIPVSKERPATRKPDMFEQALARAKSHEQTFDDRKLPRKRRRATTILTAALSLLLIAGVVAYMNAPVLSMRLASTRAGFDAKLPSYSPAGYTFGNLSYGPGNITVNYKSDPKHSFDITQRESGWDSEALLNNFVSSANKAYQTYERAGRTIYFYGNNTATWVDSGVWYTIDGNSSLNKNQLLDLASSM